MEFVVLWFIMGLVVALIAMNRGRSFLAWFLYGFALWPVALVHILLAARRPGAELYYQRHEHDRAPCPHCAEFIKRAAQLCPHCQQPLKAGWADPPTQPVRPRPKAPPRYGQQADRQDRFSDPRPR